MYIKISSAKWRPFSPGVGEELMEYNYKAWNICCRIMGKYPLEMFH